MRTIATSTLGLILFAMATRAQESNSTCFSLKGSTTCPAFQNFYISLTGNESRYPFLANVTDISSFDTALTEYVNSANLYLSPLGCTNRAIVPTTIPYARYSFSYMCATLIQDSLYSLPCNYQHNLSPPPLCQSTCLDYMASVESITNNIDMCPNQIEQDSQFENLNSSCIYWSGLNGTYNCIIGLANEPDNCGFSNKMDACGYCRTNGTDSCCQEIKGCHQLPIGAIVGIVLGCLVFVGAMAAIVYLFCYRNRKNTQPNYGRFTMMNNNNSGATSKHFMNDSLQKPLDHVSPQPPPPIATTPLMQDTQPLLEEFFEVKHPYPPQMGDELGLHVGDIVCVAMNFDDGWALGFNVTTGLKGVFPVVCVAPAPEELLEQLLLPAEPATTKTLVEDGTPEHLNMQQICENLKRSISISSRQSPIPPLTQHSNIPRRTASIMRNTYDYHESDSPTSPTLHTPFFDVPQVNASLLSQPEPALIETYEMHRKNNRVSKLEE